MDTCCKELQLTEGSLKKEKHKCQHFVDYIFIIGGGRSLNNIAVPRLWPHTENGHNLTQNWVHLCPLLSVALCLPESRIGLCPNSFSQTQRWDCTAIIANFLSWHYQGKADSSWKKHNKGTHFTGPYAQNNFGMVCKSS